MQLRLTKTEILSFLWNHSI